MNQPERVEHQAWPMRALILLGLGALAGLMVHLLLGIGDHGQATSDPLRLAGAAFLVVGGIALALTLERLRWTWSAAFAAAAGFAVALIIWSNGDPDGWTSNQEWRFAASLLSVAIAVPLFQAARDSGGVRMESRAALDHAWTDAILWGLSCAFLVAVWLLLVLLGGLFGLIGIDSVKQLIVKPWFILMLSGGTLGTSIGRIRDRDSVIGLLHRVGRTILSVLAPILGLGLLLFVGALPFTGLEPLWRETGATTPILLACILAAFLLANAVIGNSNEEESKTPILALGAMALGAAMLPLAIVAAISMSKRIGQYGLSPDRLWAAIVVAVAVIVSAAYLLALVRGRRNWAPLLRRANVMIAAGIGILAYLLALPILDFGAVSARDQVARLNSGRIAPEKFDWTAMRFDFGPAGRRAVEQLARGGNSRVSGLARSTLALEQRSDSYYFEQELEQKAKVAESRLVISVRPNAVPLPAELRDKLLGRSNAGDPPCNGDGECLVYWKPGDSEATVFMDRCPPSAAPLARRPSPRAYCSITASMLVSTDRGWELGWSRDVADASDGGLAVSDNAAERNAMLRRQRQAIDRGEATVREVKRRQLFIGGKPVGDPFE